MKTLLHRFTKRLALVMGLLFTALICMGIVYIDTVYNYWQFSGGFIRLVVNTNAQAVITIATNSSLQSVGINSNNTARSFVVKGFKPATNTTGNGTAATTTGAIVLSAGDGGVSSATNAGTVNGGAGGVVAIVAGAGSGAQNATTNALGGAGGALTITSGAGGAGQTAGGLATNAITGGAAGSFTLTAGAGGAPSVAATNTVGGAGGSYTLSAGTGGSPSAGWSQKGGNGGLFQMTGGQGGSGTRTNGGSGGSFFITGGSAGAATSGNAGSAGVVQFTGGFGAAGTTNSNGGNILMIGGGAGGSGAVDGSVFAGRDQDGNGNGGGFGVGISNSAIITNIIFLRTNLNFPSTLVGATSDLVAMAMTGRTNAIVNVGPPPSALMSGGFYSGFCSNGIIFVRFAFIGAISADPVAGDFEVEVTAYR